MAEISAGSAKLLHYLSEAYGLEKRLETALEAHIAMTTHAAYKKRLRQHLTETKHHGREVGKRIKLRLEHEFVVGGYTDPDEARKHFGALLAGFYEGKKLKFSGRVGAGFSEKLLKSLCSDLSKIQVESCPFFNVPTPGGSRWDQGLTPTDLKRCHWVKPKLVCQVKFTEWTRDDRLRQPVFLGLREDKSANEVVREKTD